MTASFALDGEIYPLSYEKRDRGHDWANGLRPVKVGNFWALGRLNDSLYGAV